MGIEGVRRKERGCAPDLESKRMKARRIATRTSAAVENNIGHIHRIAIIYNVVLAHEHRPPLVARHVLRQDGVPCRYLGALFPADVVFLFQRLYK